jgi:hypothetical protein
MLHDFEKGGRKRKKKKKKLSNLPMTTDKPAGSVATRGGIFDIRYT